MKTKLILFLVFILAGTTLFDSCVASKGETTLYGRWKMVKHFTKGEDDTQRYFDTYEVYAFDFQKGGVYFEYFSYIGLINSAKGTWRIVDKNQLLLNDKINPANSRSFKILELTKDKFRFEWSDTELIMVPIPEGEKIFNYQ